MASAYNAGDSGSIPGSGRSGGGNGNPVQYSCLENPKDRGPWLQSTGYGPWGRKESDTTEQLHFLFGCVYRLNVWFIFSSYHFSSPLSVLYHRWHALIEVCM